MHCPRLDFRKNTGCHFSADFSHARTNFKIAFNVKEQKLKVKNKNKNKVILYGY